MNLFFTKFEDNVNSPVLKDLCKFQVDARVTNAQYWENQNEAHEPTFPYNITENSPTSLAYNSAVFVSNNFKFGTKTSYMVL